MRIRKMDQESQVRETGQRYRSDRQIRERKQRTSPKVSTTPLRQWGFHQCLPFSCTTLRYKHCQHPIVILVVVDTFGPGQIDGQKNRPERPARENIPQRHCGSMLTLSFLVKNIQTLHINNQKNKRQARETGQRMGLRDEPKRWARERGLLKAHFKSSMAGNPLLYEDRTIILTGKATA